MNHFVHQTSAANNHCKRKKRPRSQWSDETATIYETTSKQLVAFLKRYCQHQTLYNVIQSSSGQAGAAPTTRTTLVLQTVLERMDGPTQEQRQSQADWKRVQESIDLLLANVKRDKASIAVLPMLLDMCNGSSSFTGRAASHLLHCLMQKSAHSRRYWWDEHPHWLMEWMDGSLNQPSSPWPSECYVQLRAWCESYANNFPTLHTACLRLEQLAPYLLVRSSDCTNDTTTTPIHPPERRRLRDTALQQWQVAVRRVTRTLTKAHILLERLVPRVDSTRNAPQQQDDNEQNSMESEEEEDDDSLDWEEGDHEAAVDRTLQAMAEAGTVQDGGVEVAVQPQGPLVDTASRTKLQAITAKLQKQLEVLSQWVDALNTSDTMVSMNGDALVQMNSAQLRRRHDVCRSLSDLKQRVATTIASSVALGLSTTTDKDSSPPVRRSQVTSLHLERPSQSVRPVIRRERARSNRIQVK